MNVFGTIAILILLAASSPSILADHRSLAAPRAPLATVADNAVSKSDPFTWLEEARGERALEWVRAQNGRTLGVLQADPRFAQYYARVLGTAENRNALAAGDLLTARLVNGWVHNLWKDDLHPRGVWRRATLKSFLGSTPDWEILLDLDRLSATEGRNWELRLIALECQPSGRRCMVSLIDADSGGGDGTYREFDLDDCVFVEHGFDLPQAESALVWKDENTLWVATNLDDRASALRRGAELVTVAHPTSVRAWHRGKSLADAEVVFQGTSETFSAVPFGYEDATGERLIVVSSVDFQGRMGHWRLRHDGRLQPMTLPPRHTGIHFYRKQCLVRLREDWKIGGKTWPAGALVSIALDGIEGPAPQVLPVMIPGPREFVNEIASTRFGVLVCSFHNINGRIDKFDLRHGRWQREPIALPDHGMVRIVMAESRSAMAFASYQNLLQPVTLYELNVARTQARSLRSQAPQFDSSRFLSEQLEAESSDGTRIPYFVVRARAFKYDGHSPTIMRGYGGFGVALYPMYLGPGSRFWLEQGGTYVLANIRGGGEFGPTWHQAGIKKNRQHSYDDFIAVAEDLIRRKITSQRRLGIEGMSNGGLLVGVVLNQRPELFRAAVAKVPALDLLRPDLARGRAYAANEYGSPDIPDERAFLERTSPYQNLRPRSDFPMPLLIPSTDDDTVHPAQARKFAAKMQSLGMPFMFYESAEGGHSASITAQNRAQTDAVEYTYLARTLMD